MYDEYRPLRRRAARRRCRVARMFAPKIEPEIVFKLSRPIEPGERSGRRRARLDRVDRARLRDHRLRLPRLEVSAGRLRRRVRAARRRWSSASRSGSTPEMIPRSDRGAASHSRCGLFKNGELVEEGSGKNSLCASPALCLGGTRRPAIWEGAQAPSRWGPARLVSSGTLTEIEADCRWRHMERSWPKARNCGTAFRTQPRTKRHRAARHPPPEFSAGRSLAPLESRRRRASAPTHRSARPNRRSSPPAHARTCPCAAGSSSRRDPTR